jgi:hypothetical protein
MMCHLNRYMLRACAAVQATSSHTVHMPIPPDCSHPTSTTLEEAICYKMSAVRHDIMEVLAPHLHPSIRGFTNIYILVYGASQTNS